MTSLRVRVTTRVLPTGEVIVVVEPIPAADSADADGSRGSKHSHAPQLDS